MQNKIGRIIDTLYRVNSIDDQDLKNHENKKLISLICVKFV